MPRFKFPYTDLYALNLDWIIERLNDDMSFLEEVRELINSLGSVVNTVNGQSGDVTITADMINGARVNGTFIAPGQSIQSLESQIPTLYNQGVRFILCGTGNSELYILTSQYGQTPTYAKVNTFNATSGFVKSVNGADGAVTITADMINDTDINLFEFADDGVTISDYTPAELSELYDAGIRFILTMSTTGDYNNIYTLFKDSDGVDFIAYTPTGAQSGVISVNGMSGAISVNGENIPMEAGQTETIKAYVSRLFYSKSEVNSMLELKADKTDTYTKSETNTLLNAKANQASTYTKTETDTLLNAKANQATTYTKTQTDNLLNAKADQATTYTKNEVDSIIAGTYQSDINEFFDSTTLPNDTNLRARKSSRSVTLYIGISQNVLGSGTSVNVGTVKNAFKSGFNVVLPFYSRSSPYLPVGTAWLDVSGNLTIYKPADVTGGYVSGTYNTNN